MKRNPLQRNIGRTTDRFGDKVISTGRDKVKSKSPTFLAPPFNTSDRIQEQSFQSLKSTLQTIDVSKHPEEFLKKLEPHIRLTGWLPKAENRIGISILRSGRNQCYLGEIMLKLCQAARLLSSSDAKELGMFVRHRLIDNMAGNKKQLKQYLDDWLKDKAIQSKEQQTSPKFFTACKPINKSIGVSTDNTEFSASMPRQSCASRYMSNEEFQVFTAKLKEVVIDIRHTFQKEAQLFGTSPQFSIFNQPIWPIVNKPTKDTLESYFAVSYGIKQFIGLKDVEIVGLMEPNYEKSGYSAVLAFLKKGDSSNEEFRALLLPYNIERPEQLDKHIVDCLHERFEFQAVIQPHRPIENLFTYWLEGVRSCEIT